MIAAGLAGGLPSFLGCFGDQGPPGYEEVYRDYQNRTERVLDYPYDQQIDILLHTLGHRHPPDLGLAEAVASNGKPILPVILEGLKTEKKEYLQHDLILVLEMMDARTYPLDAETEVIATIRGVIASMKDPKWKRMSEESLQAILADQG